MKWWRRIAAGLFLAGGVAPALAAGQARCELVTSGAPTDLAPFYERTLGWTAEKTGPNALDAVIFKRGGRPVAGISHRAGVKMSAPRSRWVAFFQGGAGSATRTAEAGGRELESSHPGATATWKLSLLTDAEGAVFGLAQAMAEGAETARGFWPVLLARETPSAAEFYRGVLGGERADETRTPLFPGDFLLTAGGRPWAGVQPAGVSGQAGWMVLIAVGDIEAATAAARRAGGRVLRAPQIDLIGGRVAVIADPAGGVFGLCEALPTRQRSAATPGTAASYEVEALSR